MNRAQFFDSLRPHLNLTTQNVMGMDTLLDYAEHLLTPLQWFAYILSTAFWETASTCHPVREAYWLSEDWRKRHLRYYPYYGRGYVQLTHKANYQKVGDLLGVGSQFVDKPDLALDEKWALPILFQGMTKGLFTGKALPDYIDTAPTDHDLQEYINARRIVNGTDSAKTIAQRALWFEQALIDASYIGSEPDVPKPEDLPILSAGMQGVSVRYLQKLLSEHGFAVTQDGVFGARTQEAVESYQRRNLVEYGTVGPTTWAALVPEVQPS